MYECFIADLLESTNEIEGNLIITTEPQNTYTDMGKGTTVKKISSANFLYMFHLSNSFDI